MCVRVCVTCKVPEKLHEKEKVGETGVLNKQNIYTN